MSSSGRLINNLLPDIKERLEKTNEDGLDTLFASVLVDIRTISSTLSSTPVDQLKALDPEEAAKLIDLFSSPTKPSLLREYDVNYDTFMWFYKSLHQNDLGNLDPKQKKQIDSYAQQFPELIENLMNELKTMLKIDKHNEHQKHYTDLLSYLTQFKTLIRSEEKKYDSELYNNSLPKSTV